MGLWTVAACAVAVFLGWTETDVAHAREQTAPGAARHDPRLHTRRHPRLRGPFLVRGAAKALTGG